MQWRTKAGMQARHYDIVVHRSLTGQEVHDLLDERGNALPRSIDADVCLLIGGPARVIETLEGLAIGGERPSSVCGPGMVKTRCAPKTSWRSSNGKGTGSRWCSSVA